MVACRNSASSRLIMRDQWFGRRHGVRSAAAEEPPFLCGFPLGHTPRAAGASICQVGHKGISCVPLRRWMTLQTVSQRLVSLVCRPQQQAEVDAVGLDWVRSLQCASCPLMMLLA